MHISGQDTADGQPKNIIVEIQNKAINKPFLCGYKDKITGIINVKNCLVITKEIKWVNFLMAFVHATYEYICTRTSVVSTPCLHVAKYDCFLFKI